MSYTPPASTEVDFVFSGGFYAPPVGGSVSFDFTPTVIGSVGIQFATTALIVAHHGGDAHVTLADIVHVFVSAETNFYAEVRRKLKLMVTSEADQPPAAIVEASIETAVFSIGVGCAIGAVYAALSLGAGAQATASAVGEVATPIRATISSTAGPPPVASASFPLFFLVNAGLAAQPFGSATAAFEVTVLGVAKVGRVGLGAIKIVLGTGATARRGNAADTAVHIRFSEISAARSGSAAEVSAMLAIAAIATANHIQPVASDVACVLQLAVRTSVTHPSQHNYDSLCVSVRAATVYVYTSLVT